MKKAYKIVVVFLSVGGLGFGAYGILQALRSPLFLAKVIEVTNTDTDIEGAEAQGDRRSGVLALDPQEVIRLAGIPTGSANLFDLELGPVEARLLTNPWIRSVKIQKRFPETVSIAVQYRQPVGVLQSLGSPLVYLDSNGESFGSMDLSQDLDLPLFIGFDRQPLARLQEGIELARKWQNHDLQRLALVSSIQWDAEQGFKVQAVYHLAVSGGVAADPAPSSTVSRVTIQWGPTVYGSSAETLSQLQRVIRYLSEHSIASSQILADAGKKIVVKTARGS